MTIESLANRHMLILGGSDGMGYAVAAYLLRSGATVTITGRKEDKLASARARLAEETGARDGQVRTQAGDARDPAAVEAAVATATGPKGELDGIFIVAGAGHWAPVLDSGIDAADQMYAINMYPFINAIQIGGRVMKAHGGGSIVGLSSAAAFCTAPGMAAYGAAKAALEYYVRCAADELGEHKIRVNAVRSGYTSTGSTTGIVADPVWNAKFVEATPLGEAYGEAADFGPMVSLLLSDDTRWITGQIFAIDGGLTLRGYKGRILDPTSRG
jgi:NAD(P)-dependent dehydrogenase (short-subunit alcohol dehydrogenase family)